MIQDQFTHLNGTVCRQQIYEQRQVAAGKCRRGDGRKIFKWRMCRKCVKIHLLKKKANYAKYKHPIFKRNPDL